jgi:2-oxoglutarate dehydrogenase E1 component
MDREQNTLSLMFVEHLYADYLRDARSVPDDWRQYFEQLSRQESSANFRTRPAFKPRSIFHSNGHQVAVEHENRGDQALQHLVDQLIRNYRVRGHIVAHLDPLGIPRPAPPELDPATYGLSEADMDRPFATTSIPGPDVQTLRQILDRLRNTYCRSIGAQFMHIDDLSVRQWLQQRMEGTQNRVVLARDEQLRVLRRLTDAVVFEQFVQKKYVGAKSFSLEGAESLIPLLDLAIEKAGEQGVDEIVLGMAHRGRLNVLANIMGKQPQAIFREFDDTDSGAHIGAGDVKYHLGYSNDWVTSTGRKVHLSLCFNPSHLEFINPVAMGRMRSKQDRAGDVARDRGMVLLIHGDAAFIGEGVAQETLNLSQLEGYRTGGTMHVIVNNQIGFTTGPQHGRSCVYASDVAKMLQAPIFHVNGEDPEAVAQVVRLGMDFRKTFKSDVVIDMYCYRRRGHNEGDEPAFTQPLLYQAIDKRSPVREAYLEHLLQLGGVTREEARGIWEQRVEQLEKALTESRAQTYQPPRQHALRGMWSGYTGGAEHQTPDVPTGVESAKLAQLLGQLAQVPATFHPHPKIRRWLQARVDMSSGQQPLDWAAAEALAYATIALEGKRVRLTGQDSQRGTFSQRHAVLHDVHDDHTYCALQHLAADQAPVEIFNSPLSEIGVLGFEYGYSLDWPDGLVAWEAQFGDFVNVAQVIIDQFITSAEDKWQRLSGLVLLLPHGFEGQGPEHSSARLERWLTLAAEDNIQICYPTTPAQIFHLLRRQVVRPLRKPLVVMTPKSLLRHPEVVSTLDELAQGTYQRVIPDEGELDAKAVKRILLCTGKIYYDLAKRRDELNRRDVAIARVEQLYPMPMAQLRQVLSPYRDGTPVVWVQEEPRNMGAWSYLRANLGDRLLERFPLTAVSRPESASPATGSHNAHKHEQERLVSEAFAGL